MPHPHVGRSPCCVRDAWLRMAVCQSRSWLLTSPTSGEAFADLPDPFRVLDGCHSLSFGFRTWTRSHVFRAQRNCSIHLPVMVMKGEAGGHAGQQSFDSGSSSRTMADQGLGDVCPVYSVPNLVDRNRAGRQTFAFLSFINSSCQASWVMLGRVGVRISYQEGRPSISFSRKRW